MIQGDKTKTRCPVCDEKLRMMDVPRGGIRTTAPVSSTPYKITTLKGQKKKTKGLF